MCYLHTKMIFFTAFALVISSFWVTGTQADVLVIGGNTTVARFKDMPADFGQDIPDDGVEGYVVIAEPQDACEPVKGPPFNGTVPVWILLIRRGKCNFDIKVLNAQNAGYIAAIVFDNNTSRNLIPMNGQNGYQISIPSVFISYADGLFLKQFIYPMNFYVRITPGYIPFSLNAILLPFAIVVGICFLVLSIVLVVKYLKDRRRRMRHRLPKSQLKKLPIRKYKKGEGNDVCAICLDEFEEGTKLRVLPCHHQYHIKCVDPWLLKNKRVCPVCKRKVIPGEDSDDEAPAGTDTSETTPLLAAASSTPFDDAPLPAHPQPHTLVDVALDGDEAVLSDVGIVGAENAAVDTEDIHAEDDDTPLISLTEADAHHAAI